MDADDEVGAPSAAALTACASDESMVSAKDHEVELIKKFENEMFRYEWSSAAATLTTIREDAVRYCVSDQGCYSGENALLEYFSRECTNLTATPNLAEQTPAPPPSLLRLICVRPGTVYRGDHTTGAAVRCLSWTLLKHARISDADQLRHRPAVVGWCAAVSCLVGLNPLAARVTGDAHTDHLHGERPLVQVLSCLDPYRADGRNLLAPDFPGGGDGPLGCLLRELYSAHPGALRGTAGGDTTDMALGMMGRIHETHTGEEDDGSIGSEDGDARRLADVVAAAGDDGGASSAPLIFPDVHGVGMSCHLPLLSEVVPVDELREALGSAAAAAEHGYLLLSWSYLPFPSPMMFSPGAEVDPHVLDKCAEAWRLFHVVLAESGHVVDGINQEKRGIVHHAFHGGFVHAVRVWKRYWLEKAETADDIPVFKYTRIPEEDRLVRLDDMEAAVRRSRIDQYLRSVAAHAAGEKEGRAYRIILPALPDSVGVEPPDEEETSLLHAVAGAWFKLLVVAHAYCEKKDPWGAGKPLSDDEGQGITIGRCYGRHVPRVQPKGQDRQIHVTACHPKGEVLPSFLLPERPLHAVAGCNGPRMLLRLALRMYPEEVATPDRWMRTPLHIGAAVPLEWDELEETDEDDSSDEETDESDDSSSDQESDQGSEDDSDFGDGVEGMVARMQAGGRGGGEGEVMANAFDLNEFRLPNEPNDSEESINPASSDSNSDSDYDVAIDNVVEDEIEADDEDADDENDDSQADSTSNSSSDVTDITSAHNSFPDFDSDSDSDSDSITVYPPDEKLALLTESCADALKMRDAFGWLPLHVVCAHPMACDNDVGDVRIVLDAHPAAAREVDGAGRLPLHLALASGKTLTGGVRALLEAGPGTVSWSDSVTRLSPFMLAAVGGDADVGTVFFLLKKDPLLVRGGIRETVEERYLKRKNAELVLKNKALSAVNVELRKGMIAMKQKIVELEMNMIHMKE